MEHIRKWAGWFRLLLLSKAGELLHLCLVQVFLAFPLLYRLYEYIPEPEKVSELIGWAYFLVGIFTMAWAIMSLLCLLLLRRDRNVASVVRGIAGTLLVQTGLLFWLHEYLSSNGYPLHPQLMLRDGAADVWLCLAATLEAIGIGILLFPILNPPREDPDDEP